MMDAGHRGWILRYGSAVVAVALAWLVRWLLGDVLGARLPFGMFYLAVLFVVTRHGRGPGLLALSLGGLTAWCCFIPPRLDIGIQGMGDQLALALYFVLGLGLVFVGQAMRTARQRAEAFACEAREGHQQLEQKIAEQQRAAEENQRLAAEARRSEEHFRFMADTIPDILFIGHSDGSIEYINQRVRDHTGMPPEAMLGDGWQAVVHPDDLGGYLADLARCLDAGQPFEAAFRMRMADGSYRWFVSRARPVHGPGGRIVRWYGTDSDIHDRKCAEEALHEADRRKDEFLATLAHELRNPLAPIRNAVQLLKASAPADERLVWAHDVIERQIQQMTRLVDDLLDVSRITRGNIELRRQRVEIRDVVDSALELSRPLIDSAGHTLAIDLPAAPLPVYADPTRLAQVLANLLNNAAKYTEPGGHIWLSAAREHGQVILRVRDSGIGIPPEMLPHIFDVFAQAHAPLASGGLGIGLTLVRRLVEMHGGTVLAHSEGAGKGSEMVVRLPAMDAEDVDDAGRLAHHGPAEDAPQQRRRILVVDDNLDSAETLAMLLEMRGNEVRVAYSGGQAMEEARAFVPGVVLLDIGLPDMSGYDVARALRQEPALAQALLIAQTGWGQEEDRRCSREAGFDYHLVKPIDLDTLLRLLSEDRR